MMTTRTSSPYFSPNSARAPDVARIVEAHETRRHLGVFQDDVIGDVLDLLEFGARDRLGVRDIEAQPLGRDQRALLRHMIAEHEAQRLMQDMGRRMVGAGRRAGGVIDREFDRHAGAGRALDDRDIMDDEVAELFAGVAALRAEVVGGDFADVADLAAGLAVERRLVEDQRSALARRRACRPRRRS